MHRHCNSNINTAVVLLNKGMMIDMNQRMSQNKVIIGTLKDSVRLVLEENYKLDINTTNQILDTHFTDNFLPFWYFVSNTPDEIADHLYIMSQLLDANVDYLEKVSDDGMEITYFLNIGRDFPGRLARIIRENVDMDIVSYDSIKTLSGIRIISIEKKGRRYNHNFPQSNSRYRYLIDYIRDEGEKKHYTYSDHFIRCLSERYLREEHNNKKLPQRIIRHLKMYEAVMTSKKIQLSINDSSQEPGTVSDDEFKKRIMIGVINPKKDFILNILDIIHSLQINIIRSYYDLFESDDHDSSVGIMSLYISDSTDADVLLQRIVALSTDATMITPRNRITILVESLVRRLNSEKPEIEVDECIEEIRKIANENRDINDPSEMGNFLVNAFSDLMAAAEFLGISDNSEILKLLLRFDSVSEFYVPSPKNGNLSNKPAFRIKHNSVRGKAYKGGLRIDPIVEFSEVAALSFMMTWKCSRSKILFGGGKGGLMLKPNEFSSKIDFFDTLTNYGRSIFLVTGPTKDVPAGDVGCGPTEIGHLFEGFKSSLRDLALMVYGTKKIVGMIGNNLIITVDGARKILKENFAIDINDRELLRHLTISEKYIELVCSAQITGKPRMGIAARNGATGKGLCFCILAAVNKLFLENRWEVCEDIAPEERYLLEKVAAIKEVTIVTNNGNDIIHDDEWDVLDRCVFPKLLKGKKVIVQGAGKVGGSLLRELLRYNVNIIAVSDASGAVIGDYLDVDEILNTGGNFLKDNAGINDKKIVNAQKNVTKRIYGMDEGASTLELECDILVLAALENAITAKNANLVKTKIIACGSNGAHSSKAEIILEKRGILVLYDFLASSGGVITSYFEWLKNLHDRFFYEATEIKNEAFDINTIDSFIMPEYNTRIKEILLIDESSQSSYKWNMLMRDILISAVNDDYDFSRNHLISMKTAGFVNAILRVLTASLLKMSPEKMRSNWDSLPEQCKTMMKSFFLHPEAKMYNNDPGSLIASLM